MPWGDTSGNYAKKQGADAKKQADYAKQQADLLASKQPKVDKAIVDAADAKESANEAVEVTEQLLDGNFDAGKLNTNIEKKLNDLEVQYAPKLTSVSAQLADKANKVETEKQILASGMYLKVTDTNIIPSDFKPKLPFNLVFDAKSNVSHDWDLNQFKTGADTNIWVSRTSGNDSTGTGTETLPFQTLIKAWTHIQTLTWTKAVIKAVGNFKRGDCPYDGWIIPTGKTLSILGDGATTIFSDKATTMPWTVDGNSYKTTRASTFNVVDLTAPMDSNGLRKPLIQASSVAECQATIGSWYTDNVSVWVRALDNRQPDVNVEVILYNQSLYFILNENSTVYLEGIVKRGNVGANGTNGKGRLILNKMKYGLGGGTNSNGLDVDDVNDVYSFDCVTAYNTDDGFNYHYFNTPDPKSKLVFESNCISYENGRDTGDQASTCHEGVSNIRINSNYTGKTGCAITDVGGCDTIILGSNMTSTVGEAVNVYDAGHRLTMVNCKAFAQAPYKSIKSDYARLRNNIVNQDVNIVQAVLV